MCVCDFPKEFLIQYDGINDWPFCILWTDDTHSTITAIIKIKNCVLGADINWCTVVPAPLYNTKVTVWCAIAGITALGPYFFQEVTPP